MTNTGNVGFISTRLAGTDGVSLESAKWEDVFERLGFNCFYLAGELDRPEDRSRCVPEAHFKHPEVKEIHDIGFGRSTRTRELTRKTDDLKQHLKDQLHRFIEDFDLHVLVVENALAIPMNVPLGLALAEVIAETGIRTIAHHHDFVWERTRFQRSPFGDYIRAAFPPMMPSIRHVVINSISDEQVSLRTGVSATLIPNVMDFATPPPETGAFASDLRRDFGVGEDDLFVLQPTRIIQRKGIEHAIELVSRLDRPAKLVITHAPADEGPDYEKRVRDISKLMGVDTRFVADLVERERGKVGDGTKFYSLEDVYPHADLVTYPSVFEGFGNAFLEAIYFRKPLVVNRYSIYEMDIKPRGFRCVEMSGFCTDRVIAETHRLLNDPELVADIVEHNFELGKRYFSYEVLDRKLGSLITDVMAHDNGR